MNKSEIQYWNEKYDKDHPWWTLKEKELGDRFRRIEEFTKDDLIEINNWKFKTDSRIRISNLRNIQKNYDIRIKNISNRFFHSDLKSDRSKVDLLCKLKGVGTSLASTIMTFYNPQEYGVFDKHLWKELFGKEPQYLYETENYLKVLSFLREEAKQHCINVRTVEKAYFKKNLDES